MGDTDDHSGSNSDDDSNEINDGDPSLQSLHLEALFNENND